MLRQPAEFAVRAAVAVADDDEPEHALAARDPGSVGHPQPFGRSAVKSRLIRSGAGVAADPRRRSRRASHAAERPLTSLLFHQPLDALAADTDQACRIFRCANAEAFRLESAEDVLADP